MSMSGVATKSQKLGEAPASPLVPPPSPSPPTAAPPPPPAATTATSPCKSRSYHRFSSVEKQLLEAEFERNPFPDKKHRDWLANLLERPPSSINAFFQNRRRSHRKMCGSDSLSKQIRWRNVDPESFHSNNQGAQIPSPSVETVSHQQQEFLSWLQGLSSHVFGPGTNMCNDALPPPSHGSHPSNPSTPVRLPALRLLGESHSCCSSSSSSSQSPPTSQTSTRSSASASSQQPASTDSSACFRGEQSSSPLSDEPGIPLPAGAQGLVPVQAVHSPHWSTTTSSSDNSSHSSSMDVDADSMSVNLGSTVVDDDTATGLGPDEEGGDEDSDGGSGAEAHGSDHHPSSTAARNPPVENGAVEGRTDGPRSPSASGTHSSSGSPSLSSPTSSSQAFSVVAGTTSASAGGDPPEFVGGPGASSRRPYTGHGGEASPSYSVAQPLSQSRVVPLRPDPMGSVAGMFFSSSRSAPSSGAPARTPQSPGGGGRDCLQSPHSHRRHRHHAHALTEEQLEKEQRTVRHKQLKGDQKWRRTHHRTPPVGDSGHVSTTTTSAGGGGRFVQAVENRNQRQNTHAPHKYLPLPPQLETPLPPFPTSLVGSPCTASSPLAPSLHTLRGLPSRGTPLAVSGDRPSSRGPPRPNNRQVAELLPASWGPHGVEMPPLPVDGWNRAPHHPSPLHHGWSEADLFRALCWQQQHQHQHQHPGGGGDVGGTPVAPPQDP